MIRTINFKVKSKSISYKRYCYQCDREMHIQNNGDCYSRFSSLEIVSAHSHGYHHFIKNIVEKKNDIISATFIKVVEKYSSVTCSLAEERYLVNCFCSVIYFFVTLYNSKMAILTF